MTRKPETSKDANQSFRRLRPPPEFDPDRAQSELAAATRDHRRKLRVKESWMQESHFGGVLEDVPGFVQATALTRGLGSPFSSRDPARSVAPPRLLREGHTIDNPLRPEVAFGVDGSWVQVPDAAQVPFRCICHLEIVYESGRTATGSGWFAGPDTIVTAGHNVLNGELQEWARDIRIIPGRNGNRSGPYGETHAVYVDALEGWKNAFDPASDLAVIKTADQSLGLATGWFGFAVMSDSDLDEAPLIQSAGYPALTKPYATQWYDAGRAGRYSSAFISYWVDTEEGQSGAPIFFTNPEGQRWVVATHVYGQSQSNLGQRVTEDVFRAISEWVA